MSGDLSTSQGTQASASSPAAELFQKAHARMVGLRRLDEQMLQLLDQRQKLRQELYHLQQQINAEFERVMNEPPIDPGHGLRPARDATLDHDAPARQPSPAAPGPEAEHDANGEPVAHHAKSRKNYAFVNVAGSSAAPVPADGAWVNPAINALRAAVGANVIAAERSG
jgi:TolA-binding protein